MNKLNRTLLTIFLILGILFFGAVIYIFVTNEIIPKTSGNSKHTVNINTIKLIKNEYLDTALIRRLDNTRETIDYDEYGREFCQFLIINLADSTTYSQSGTFNLKLAVPPQTVEFYNNSSIPQTTLGDKYKIVISCNKKNIIELPIDNFYNLLDLKNKKDNLTEKKEIKITSTDKKVIAYAAFTVD